MGWWIQGYDADNPNIELLRLRNFTIGKALSDEEVINPNGLDTIVDLIAAMVPFVSLSFFFSFAPFGIASLLN